MTYLFAIAAVFLSLILLRGRSIHWVNYVWLLLPIDMYGVAIAGFTLKPWMLFMVVVALSCFSSCKVSGLRPSKTRLIALSLICAGLFISDILNGLLLSSVMQHLMFLVVYMFAFVYTATAHLPAELEEILEVTVAAAIGYSAVYVVAWVLGEGGFPEIVTQNRMEPGLILTQGAMVDGEYVASDRLRGFLIDPNTLGCTLVVAYTYSLVRVIRFRRDENNSLARYLMAILLSLVVIWLCNSRTCAAIFSLLLAIACVRGMRESKARLLGGILAFLALILFIAIFALDNVGLLLDSIYGNRASAFSEDGRFTIWKVSFDALVDKAFLIGFGENQIQYYSGLGLACHNTWLEWLCGNGIIVGSAGALFFVSVGFLSFSPRGMSEAASVLRYAYLAMIIMLSFVDNFTNSNLIFAAFVLMSLQNKSRDFVKDNGSR